MRGDNMHGVLGERRAQLVSDIISEFGWGVRGLLEP